MTVVTEGVSVFFSSLVTLAMGVPLVLGLVGPFRLTHAQVIWAQVAIAIVMLLGPVFIPRLVFKPLAFLFWGWFRTLMVYCERLCSRSHFFRRWPPAREPRKYEPSMSMGVGSVYEPPALSTPTAHVRSSCSRRASCTTG